jgi:hypothetical protein
MVNIDDLVGSFLVITNGFSLHFQLNPDPITIRLRRRKDMDGRNVLQSPYSSQDIFENFLFQFSMKSVIDMLPLTAPAYPEIRTGGFYSPGRRFDNLPQAPHGIVLLLFDNFNPDLLIFERIRDENHFTVHSPNPVSFIGHGFDVDLCFPHVVKNSMRWREIQFHPGIGG